MTVLAITDDEVLLLSTISKFTRDADFAMEDLDTAMVITQAANLSNFPVFTTSNLRPVRPIFIVLSSRPLTVTPSIKITFSLFL